MGFFSCRSIWTFASHQSSILPASLTPAAPAPPVTTLYFPTTRYQTSPASLNTSTSMAVWKHKPPPPPHLGSSPLPSDGLLKPFGTVQVATLLSHANTAMRTHYLWYMIAWCLKEVDRDLTETVFFYVWMNWETSSPCSFPHINTKFYMWFLCL